MNLFAIKLEDGAKTILYLAKSKDVKHISGKYFIRVKFLEYHHTQEIKISAICYGMKV